MRNDASFAKPIVPFLNASSRKSGVLFDDQSLLEDIRWGVICQIGDTPPW